MGICRRRLHDVQVVREAQTTLHVDGHPQPRGKPHAPVWMFRDLGLIKRGFKHAVAQYCRSGIASESKLRRESIRAGGDHRPAPLRASSEMLESNPQVDFCVSVQI